MASRLGRTPRRLRLRRRTVRQRLTLLYGVLFLASGAVLLAITYLLVRHSDAVHITGTQLVGPGGSGHLPDPAQLPDLSAQLRTQAEQQRSQLLDQLLVQSGIALGLTAVIAVGLGWLVAGRVLRPLRTMTARTRRISERNLDERLALPGPSDELTDLGDTIDGLLTRLENAFQAQRRFVANASHELRTPLAMMRTSLDVAVGKPGARPPQLEALEGKLREGLDRADRLVEDFLVLARAQHGVLPEPTVVSLPEIVSAAIGRYGAAIAQAGIDLQYRCHAAQVYGSPTLLARMTENVLDNAIRHNEPAGWIRVKPTPRATPRACSSTTAVTSWRPAWSGS